MKLFSIFRKESIMSLEERVKSLEEGFELLTKLVFNQGKQIKLVDSKTEVLSDWNEDLSKQIYNTLELMKTQV